MKLLSYVRLFETPWTATHQAPPSMGFSRQEYWNGLPFPSPHSLRSGQKIRIAYNLKGMKLVLKDSRVDSGKWNITGCKWDILNIGTRICQHLRHKQEVICWQFVIWCHLSSIWQLSSLLSRIFELSSTISPLQSLISPLHSFIAKNYFPK